MFVTTTTFVYIAPATTTPGSAFVTLTGRFRRHPTGECPRRKEINPRKPQGNQKPRAGGPIHPAGARLSEIGARLLGVFQAQRNGELSVELGLDVCLNFIRTGCLHHVF
jgi:hypothetical protein